MTMLMILAMAMVFMTEVWLVWLPTGLPDGERAHLLAGELIVHQGGSSIAPGVSLHQDIVHQSLAC